MQAHDFTRSIRLPLSLGINIWLGKCTYRFLRWRFFFVSNGITTIWLYSRRTLRLQQLLVQAWVGYLDIEILDMCDNSLLNI